MDDGFWSSHTVRDLLLGMSGGFAGTGPLRKAGFLELCRHVIVGGMSAIACGPAISDRLEATGVYYIAIIWLTGVVGVGIGQGAIMVVEWWFGSFIKRIKND
jgi:hypothetical protein